MTAVNPHGIKITAGDQTTDSDLPEGWESIVLRDLVTQRKGKKPKKLDKNPWKGAVPYVDIKAFEMGNIRRYADPNSSVLVDADDVVVVWDGARCGHVGKVPKHGALGSTLMTIKPIMIDSDYLLRFLQLSYETINSNPRGTGIPHVAPEIFWNLELPIAPSEEQKRIVSKVDELLVRVNAAKERLTKVKEILKRFRQSVLAAASSGRLTADWREKYPDVEPASELLWLIIEERKKCYKEKYTKAKAEGLKKPKKDYEFSIIKERPSIAGWAEAKLENLIYIAGRIGWRGLKAEEYTTDGPLFLSVHGLNYGEEVDFRDAYHISMERYNESPEIQLQENDILLAKDGAGIGKIGIIKNLNQLATVNSSLLVIRSLEAFVPKYLFYFLSGPKLQNIAKVRITGSATPHLFQKDIKEFALSIPPLLEQKEIVRRAEALFKLADGIEKRVTVAGERTERLTEAILVKAFRGELIPTEDELARREDRSYEPASALLAKIEAQRKDIRFKHRPKRSRR